MSSAAPVEDAGELDHDGTSSAPPQVRRDEAGYVRVCALDELEPDTAVAVQVDGVAVALARDEHGGVHAVEDRCSHANVALSEGEVEDCTIECWLHGSRFDLRTGQPTGPPAVTPVIVYPVAIVGGDVFVSTQKES